MTTLNEVLRKIGLPLSFNDSVYAPRDSKDWEQVQFWDKFLRSSTPEQLVKNMKSRLQVFDKANMFHEDDYDDFSHTIEWYQSKPIGNLEDLCVAGDSHALSMLILSERVYLEWSDGSDHRRSSELKYLQEASAYDLQCRHIGAVLGKVDQKRIFNKHSEQRFASTLKFPEPRGTTTGVEANTGAAPRSRAPKAFAHVYNELAPMQEPSEATQPSVPSKTKDCYFMGVLAVLVVAAGTTIALYFSIALERMQDGFSAASYLVAAGGMLLGSWMAVHYRHCSCRRSSGLRSNISSFDFNRSDTTLVADEEL